MERILSSLLALPMLVWAQSYTASIRGVVTDPSRAAVPAAKVVATDANRNLHYPTTTDVAGRYVITALPPGTYTLAVEAAGFRPYARSAFELLVQQDATIDVELTVGQVTTAVEVQAAAPLLDMTSAALGQVVENKYIMSLPLVDREPLALVALAPGITPVNTQAGGQTDTNFVANGTRNASSDVILDGALASTLGINGGVTRLVYQPAVNAVQEFKVQTNFFSAEFGQTGGAIVNVVTKSGTNHLHGSAYEFHRNAALNANSWFGNRAGQTLPDFHRNVLGGTIGGPLRIPKVYNGTDRTFFFFDYEAIRQGSAATALTTVPPCRSGKGISVTPARPTAN